MVENFFKKYFNYFNIWNISKYFNLQKKKKNKSIKKNFINWFQFFVKVIFRSKFKIKITCIIPYEKYAEKLEFYSIVFHNSWTNGIEYNYN